MRAISSGEALGWESLDVVKALVIAGADVNAAAGDVRRVGGATLYV